jgi:LysR family hydrogen peroxide-inducible transcriptional activator
MFLTIKKISQVKLIIEELNTDEIIVKLNNGHLDAAIAATPLLEDKIKKSFCTTNLCIHSRKSSSFSKEEIEIEDLNIDEILLLQDGHCFRDGILNL